MIEFLVYFAGFGAFTGIVASEIAHMGRAGTAAMVAIAALFSALCAAAP